MEKIQHKLVITKLVEVVLVIETDANYDLGNLNYDHVLDKLANNKKPTTGIDIVENLSLTRDLELQDIEEIK